MGTRSKWEKGSVDSAHLHSCRFVTSTTARYNHNTTHDAAGSKKKPRGDEKKDLRGVFLCCVTQKKGGKRKLWMKEDTGGCALT